jgi:hypothetical protein
MPESILDRLERAHRSGQAGQAARTTHVGLSPVAVARMQLRTPGVCWTVPLGTLRSSYVEATARDAWVALLAEPGSGWSRQDRATGRWSLSCVPGYSPLCGDVVGRECDIGSVLAAHQRTRTNPAGDGATEAAPGGDEGPETPMSTLTKVAIAGGVVVGTVALVAVLDLLLRKRGEVEAKTMAVPGAAAASLPVA